MHGLSCTAAKRRQPILPLLLCYLFLDYILLSNAAVGEQFSALLQLPHAARCFILPQNDTTITMSCAALSFWNNTMHKPSLLYMYMFPLTFNAPKRRKISSTYCALHLVISFYSKLNTNGELFCLLMKIDT